MFLQVMAMGQEYNQNMQVRGEEEEEEDDDQVIPHFVNMMLYSNASCFSFGLFSRSWPRSASV